MKYPEPDDPLSVLLGEGLALRFASLDIFTIRQFANCDLDDLAGEHLLLQQRRLAQEFVQSCSFSAKQLKDTSVVWGFCYLSDSEYEYIVHENALKSAYILFDEYTKCMMEKRPYHPWMRIYHSFMKETAKWVGRGDTNYYTTDIDVYSYLVWRYSASFGEKDYTAGPRAIFFNWECLDATSHSKCLSADKDLAECTRNSYIADRYKQVVGINLTALVEKHQAKVFRVEASLPDKWMPTTLWEAEGRIAEGKTWENYVIGDGFFDNTSYGCVVTSSGSIPMDCLDLVIRKYPV